MFFPQIQSCAYFVWLGKTNSFLIRTFEKLIVKNCQFCKIYINLCEMTKKQTKAGRIL